MLQDMISKIFVHGRMVVAMIDGQIMDEIMVNTQHMIYKSENLRECFIKWNQWFRG